MPCSPNDVHITPPTGPSGPAIPGFGIPFSLDLPNLNPFPAGFPEDLLSLLNLLQLLIPPGALLPQLNLNFGKDIFDAIMKLLDQFMPFLMLYKFFLPILKLILCIIEVICALVNPFKLVGAIINLFTQCIPAFLALFPIFALIIMIISLLLLIIALIEYIINQILLIVLIILRNILALQVAFQDGDVTGVLAIAQKLGAMLCGFQNLFVLLAIFNIIIGIIKDILSLAFAIPPCGDDTCCTTDVCPSIIKNGNYTRETGTLKYFTQVGLSPELNPPLPPELAALFNFPIRSEMWQLYDGDQNIMEKFSNIYDAFDVFGLDPKPIFFPTDSVYNATTDPKQAPYTFDIRVFYNPVNWGRTGKPRYIRFTDCIMTTVPSEFIIGGDLVPVIFPNAVSSLAGGKGFEDDGKTVLKGFGKDGITPSKKQATLENFLHKPAESSGSPALTASDGYTFSNMTYTFKPNIGPLVTKNLITLGCVPAVALNRQFVNNVFAGDAALKTAQLRDLVNNVDFPNPGIAQQCLTTALASLRSDISAEGVANFQATANICLQKLRDDTNNALVSLVGIGFDPCTSSFTAVPPVQFTTKPITVSVTLNERNGLPLTTGVAPVVSDQLAGRITPHVTFGSISKFEYDGYKTFTAELTSPTPGLGHLMISFDNNTFCTNTLPTDNTQVPTHTLQSVPYQFIYVPVSGTPTATAEGDTDGAPSRDGSDLAGDSSNSAKSGGS
jgi:hypothetical protein